MKALEKDAIKSIDNQTVFEKIEKWLFLKFPQVIRFFKKKLQKNLERFEKNYG